MRKILRVEGASESEFDYGLAFELQTLQSGTVRVLASDCAPDLPAVRALVGSLSAPVVLLYVLHTPRSAQSAGRYQSPDLTVDQVLEFIEHFTEYFHSDARFDLWFHSRSSGQTIVFERHDLLYGYGAPEKHRAILEGLGYEKGEVVIAAPHAHYYRAEFDEAARRVQECFAWSMSPL
jgi:hypothetical protein